MKRSRDWTSDEDSTVMPTPRMSSGGTRSARISPCASAAISAALSMKRLSCRGAAAGSEQPACCSNATHTANAALTSGLPVITQVCSTAYR